MESVNLEQFEKTLAEQQFLGGQLPTAADKEAFDQVKNSAISAETHPNTFAWFCLVQRFHETVRATWAAAQAKGDKKPAAKQEAKKEEPKKEADDEFDLFGDEDEESKAAAQEAKDKMAASKTAVKAPKVIAKSLILFDVKPYEAETDLDALYKKIMAIEMDGLFWKTEYKKEPIAYGVHKLVVGCVIEDLKVSSDDLTERIEAFDEEVQSCDIAVFSKI